MIAHRLDQHERHREGRGGGDFAGRGLDEIGSRLDRKLADETDVVVGLEFAGLKDHLQVRLAAGLLHRGDLVGDPDKIPFEESSPADDHVDLRGSLADGVAGIGEPQLERVLSAGKPCRDRGHGDAAAFELLYRMSDEIRVDADRAAGRTAVADRHRLPRLAAELRDLALRVRTLQRGEVHHRDRKPQTGAFRVVLERTFREERRPRLDPDLVDGGNGMLEGKAHGDDAGLSMERGGW